MVELDVAQEAAYEDAEEISIKEDCEEEMAEYYRCDPEEEETRYSDKFGTTAKLGCFGSIVMYFVSKKQEKVRKNHKSLITRNQGFKKELNKSVRRLKDRTVSMMSLASTNWRNSKIHLAESMTNIATRSRHNSKADQRRSRHISVQDRLELYNEEFVPTAPVERVRKNSKVAFEAPTMQQVLAPASPAMEKKNSLPPAMERMNSLPAVRTRKVSKVSMFEFVPEENPNPKTQAESGLDVPY
eukprot:GFUD01020933.1.p1 GENE.GFUD01020933.1~~GFUD01020933.1.p1  ORF type:complete len:242 (+),score=59.64 GFUD01020933.1:39-764(+)